MVSCSCIIGTEVVMVKRRRHTGTDEGGMGRGGNLLKGLEKGGILGTQTQG